MFSVGDKIKCIDANHTQGKLVYGNVYTVLKVSDYGDVLVDNYQDSRSYGYKRFVLASSELAKLYNEKELKYILKTYFVFNDLDLNKLLTLLDQHSDPEYQEYLRLKDKFDKNKHNVDI